MFQLFYPKNTFDKSPFQFQEADWLKKRIQETFTSYMAYKQSNVGRVPSNHLLAQILVNITSVFNGDIIDYIQSVDQESRRIAGPMGLTTASTRGDLFFNVFYKGIPEIITVSRGNTRAIDLWWDWRKVSPVTVSAHPVTSLVLFDPIVENGVNLNTSNEYAQINIDIPLLAAQYRMYKANVPTGNIEQYLAQIVAPAMMQSHLDIVLFNMVSALMGTMEITKVKTNLPFTQPDLDTPAWRLAGNVKEALLNRSLTERQILSTIPALYTGKTALEATLPPSILLGAQTLWVLHSQAVDKAKLVLEVCKERGMVDRILPLLIRIKRDQIQLTQEGWYSNGLNHDTQQFLQHRWNEVLSRIPTETFESIDVTHVI